MKERPILFNAPMVRAILEGRKTQTRRVVKGVDGRNWISGLPGGFGMHILDPRAWIKCPFGQPGDRFWVRESFRFWQAEPAPDTYEFRMRFEADGIERHVEDGEIPFGWSFRQNGRLIPSIHMPRWASRITLEIVDVRVERLQKISEADALFEGIPCPAPVLKSSENPWDYPPSAAFRELWESLNGPDSWKANPWVWVIEFKHLEQPASGPEGEVT